MPFIYEDNTNKAQWTSPRRLYLTADGAVVEATDPRKRTLLVAAHGSMLLAEAERLGLVDPPAPPAPVVVPDPPPTPAPAGKALAAPPQTKAVTSAPARK